MTIIKPVNRIICNIAGIIPHRGEMNLLQAVIVNNGVYTGIFQPKPSAWYFQGHFPGNPVTPLTILEEAAAQFGLIFAADTIYPGRQVLILAKEISGKMTGTPVRPDDIVTINATGELIKRATRGNMFIRGDTDLTVGGKSVATASVSGLMMPIPLVVGR